MTSKDNFSDFSDFSDFPFWVNIWQSVGNCFIQKESLVVLNIQIDGAEIQVGICMS